MKISKNIVRKQNSCYIEFNERKNYENKKFKISKMKLISFIFCCGFWGLKTPYIYDSSYAPVIRFTNTEENISPTTFFVNLCVQNPDSFDPPLLLALAVQV